MEENGPNKIGPNLHGLLGRKVGSVSGYSYSAAMRGSDVTWTEETLMVYLENPKAFIPNNKMQFPELKSQADREAVIAYLREVTK